MHMLKNWLADNIQMVIPLASAGAGQPSRKQFRKPAGGDTCVVVSDLDSPAPRASAYFASSIILIVCCSTSSATDRRASAPGKMASRAVGFTIPILVFPPSW